jgi:type IV pilus assembly protein PilC
MVRAGEQSGTLAEALKTVGTQLDKAYALERRIKGALIYPAVIIFVMILIGVLMFIFVVPTLMQTFTELNVQLPLPTRIVLMISDIIQHQGIFVILGIILIAFSFSWWSKRPVGRSVIHKLILKIPVIGPLATEVNAARTARTLSSLLTAGVNVLESVTITADIIQNVHFKAILVGAIELIKKGKPMSDVFGDNAKLYPVFFTEMMSVGEETGKTSEMLLGVAKYYEEDVEQKTKDMSTIIEPVLMVFIAAAVGFFAIAMISPMYSLVNVI